MLHWLITHDTKFKPISRSKTATSFSVFVQSISDKKDFTKHFRRAKFEALNDDYFTATMEAVDEALVDAKLTKDKVFAFPADLCDIVAEFSDS